MISVASRDAAWAVDCGGVHVVFGDGTLERLGELASELGGRRTLLVTDEGIVRAGHAERAAEALRRAAIEVRIFAGAGENPTTRDVERGVAAAREHAADLLVGLVLAVEIRIQKKVLQGIAGKKRLPLPLDGRQGASHIAGIYGQGDVPEYVRHKFHDQRFHLVLQSPVMKILGHTDDGIHPAAHTCPKPLSQGFLGTAPS